VLGVASSLRSLKEDPTDPGICFQLKLMKCSSLIYRYTDGRGQKLHIQLDNSKEYTYFEYVRGDDGK